jgi:hypothetical protein
MQMTKLKQNFDNLKFDIKTELFLEKLKLYRMILYGTYCYDPNPNF